MKLHFRLVPVLGLIAFPGSLAGSEICVTVVDPAGIALPGTAVKVVSLLNSGKRIVLSTDRQGQACTGSLPEGLYAVEASNVGFLNVRYYPVRIAFPYNVRLSFQLPLGEVTEGGMGIAAESDLAGTLVDNGNPVTGMRMCLFEEKQTIPAACTVTNDLGQYAMTVPPGVYWLEFGRLSRGVGRIKIDLSRPGTYRNKVSLPSGEERQ